MSTNSDMDLLVDLLGGLPDENNMYDDIEIEKGKTNEYYQGLGEYILKNIDSVDHYYHFINTNLKDYNKLNIDQKKIIQSKLFIQPVIKEKVIFKEKIIYKNAKPKLNLNDDY